MSLFNHFFLIVGGIFLSLPLSAQTKPDKLEILPLYTSLEKALKNPSQVYRLKLAGHGYTHFPKEIFQLTNLRWLHLGYNDDNNNHRRDHGETKNHLVSLPPQIASLRDLEYLDLQYNRLENIPKEIGQLKKLKTLKLGWNILRELPKEIGQLKKLKALHLTHNHINSLPKEMIKLQRLAVVTLGRNALKSFPRVLINCRNLEVLQVSNNAITQLPNELGKLSKLRHLFIYRCFLKELPASIGQLNQLQILSAFGNKLRSLPTTIGNLTCLKTLSVHHNQLTELPWSIGQLTSLKKMKIHYNHIRQLPSSVGQLEKLKYLNIKANCLENLPPSIQKIKSLISFDISNNPSLQISSSFFEWLSANYNGLSTRWGDSIHQKTIQRLKQQVQREKESEEVVATEQNRSEVFQFLLGGGVVSLLLLSIAIVNVRKERQAKWQVTIQAQKLEKQHKEILQQTEALQQTHQALEELQAFKQKVWTMVTHDLKNPLDVVIGLSGMSSSHRNTELIHQAGLQMRELIAHMMEIKNMDGTNLPVYPHHISLLTIVKEALDRVSWLARCKEVDFCYDALSFDVNADPDLIIRVIVNLLNNAIKYSEKGQIIEIKAEMANDEQIKVMVVDEGEGMSLIQQKYVFDEYYQAKATKIAQATSTGLGLSFCKLVVEQHGGSIGVDSVLGKGACFWFMLPVIQEAAKVTTQNIITYPTQKPQLGELERAYLEPYLILLKQQTVHQFTRVEDILNQIDTKDDINLIAWKKTVKSAIDICCEQSFRQAVMI